MKHTNRLINATSPYLRQHAHNPVDWYEWGEEALTHARAHDKPILVSIGYSSCHWCHVMERESFEREDIAAVMNRSYVCIKVDREERPDIDQLYMDAVQALGIHGGWPLNVFLTPEQKPFFGGTYFSPQSWVQVLGNIARAFTENRHHVEGTAEQLTQHLMRSDIGRFVKEISRDPADVAFDEIYNKLAARFDGVQGGMSNVPKFIMPSIWRFLLRYYYLSGRTEALMQVVLTLDKISAGGIYDQAGGGFARYSVDGEWFAPHFEKMLYDNAQLLSLFSESWAVTGNSTYQRIVNETFDWLQREMTHPDGGFYSALDADSEGIEGKFYCWTAEEINALPITNVQAIRDFYQVTDSGNWEHGLNILHRVDDIDAFLHRHQLTADAWNAQLSEAHAAMMNVRAERVRPGLDDKILTAWNAMTTCGLLDAFAAFGDPKFLQAAESNIRFVEHMLTDGDVLFRSFKGARSATQGFLDDYAWFIMALVRHYTVTFDESSLHRAQALTRQVLLRFAGPDEPYFYYNANDTEALIARKKDIFDNVIPSANAVMAQNLHVLGTLLDNSEWKELGAELIVSMKSLTMSEPSYMAHWAIALAEVKTGLTQVAIVGESASDVEDVRRDLQRTFSPFAVCMGMTTKSTLPLLAGKTASGNRTTVFVCENNVCLQPVHNAQDALALIRETSQPGGAIHPPRNKEINK